jgi:hypothetical protein
MPRSTPNQGGEMLYNNNYKRLEKEQKMTLEIERPSRFMDWQN